MQTEAFGAELKRRGFCDFVGVPCSYLAPLINWAINENVFVMANNEGEAVAIASGVSLVSYNSSLGNHCIDLLDFESSQTPKSSSLPKSSKNSTSTTANTRIVESTNSSLRGEANTDSATSSLRESRSDSWQSTSDSRGSILEIKSGFCETSNEIGQIVHRGSELKQSTILAQKDNAHRYGVVLMQNSGLSNALSPLTSLNHTFEIPILGFVSLRGEPNQAGQNTDEPQHELLGKITDKLLQTCDIECAFLDSRFEVACEQLAKAQKVLESNKSFFFIVRNSCFEKVALTNNPLDNPSLRGSNATEAIHKNLVDCHDLTSSSLAKQGEAEVSLVMTEKVGDSRGSIFRRFCGFSSVRRGNRTDSSIDEAEREESRKIVKKTNAQKDNAPKPTRLQALQIIQNIGTNCALLATTGKCGRELYELDDKPNQLYMVGSMGCVSALGLGVALKSRKKVIAIDGDSALLMRLGTLSGNAYYANVANKGNFCHILLDNQSHDSTGGQFNLSPFVDFVAIAKSCGYAVARGAKDLSEFSEILREFVSAESGGAWFVYLVIAKGSKKDLGRPKITPKQVAQRFSAWLNED